MAKSCPKEYGYLKNGKCVKHKKAKKPEKPSLLKSAKRVFRPLNPKHKDTKATSREFKRGAEALTRGAAGLLTLGGSEAMMTVDKFLKGRKKADAVQKSLVARRQQKKKTTKGPRKYAAK